MTDTATDQATPTPSRAKYLEHLVQYTIKALERPDHNPAILRDRLRDMLTAAPPEAPPASADRPTEHFAPAWPYPPDAEEKVVRFAILFAICAITGMLLFLLS